MPLPIAITGCGITTCLGVGKGANWEALRSGRSGLAEVTRFNIGDYPVRRGGEAPLLVPEAGERWAAPVHAPEDQRSVEMRELTRVVEEACADAGLEPERATATPNVGLTIGSSLAGSSTADQFFEQYMSRDRESVDYGLLDGYYIEEHLRQICSHLGIIGSSILISNACAAGGSSLATAARWLLTGRVDMVIATGYDPLSNFTFAGFGSLMALSTTQLRPLSKNRDGMLLGDGYAALILERGDDAWAANREPLALLAGYGESTDAHHLTQPDPRGGGAALAMRRALAKASLQPEDIGYVNCHGTATPANDGAEVSALASVFGDRLAQLPISSSKPFFGHTLGGAGTVEAVVSILALRHGFLPATLNLDELDPEFPPLDPLETGRECSLRHAMSNSFGFGGSNTSLVFSLPEEHA